MKTYKPTTPSRRNMSTPSYKAKLTTRTPHKALVKGGKRGVGRNNAGRITMRHRGGGHKRRYRLIDFRYDKHDINAKVETVEYDPYRSGFIGLICYEDGERRYVLLPQTVEVGSIVVTGEKAPSKPGNRMPLAKVSVGTFVYNIEIKPGSGAKIARSAGNYAEVIAHDAGYAHIKMPSSEVRKILDTAWASIGEVSNEEHRLVKLGKAGRSRWLGRRPTVRGAAMNAVDHPHGGGEGKSGRGRRRAVSKWGKPTGKRHKTRKAKKYSNDLILSRRHVGKKRK